MAFPFLVPVVPPRVFYRFLGSIAIVVGSIVLALFAAELAIRWIDGYSLLSVRIVRLSTKRALDAPYRGKWTRPEDAKEYLQSLPIAAGTQREWFWQSPPLPPEGPPDADVMRQWNDNADDEQMQSLYVWNRAYLRQIVCTPQTRPARPSTKRRYVFDAPHDDRYPRFRFLPNAHYPTGLRTNAFGWRGPAVPLEKPANAVRLAFVGASTTVAAHDELWSYPELIAVWLNQWAAAQGKDIRFETVNAAREGFDSESIAAVVEQEVVPVAPDLIVYYEGANQFWPDGFVKEHVGELPSQPYSQLQFPLDEYSALSRRVHTLPSVSRNEGREPPKAPLTVNWPSDLNEKDPDLRDPRLPVKLPVILHDFDRIRAAGARVGAETVLTSFMWLVYDGMTLNLSRDYALFHHLNRPYGMFSYAHMRRYADFQNRVFEKYARVNHLPFIDYASEYPRDPRLFYDAIHMSATGIRLQAWIMFQHLVPMIEERIQSGRLPNRQAVTLPEPPKYERLLIPATDIWASCPQR